MKLHVQRRSVEEIFFENFELFVALPLVVVDDDDDGPWMPQERSFNGATKEKYDEESLSRNDVV